MTAFAIPFRSVAMNVSGILTPGKDSVNVSKLSRVRRRRSSIARIVNLGSLPARPVPIPRTKRLPDSCWRVKRRLARRPGSCSRIRITPPPIRILFQISQQPEQLSIERNPKEPPSMTLLVVSNRLPFTVSNRDNKLVFRASPGGLVSGLTAYLDWAKQSASRSDYLWVGWPGMEVEEGSREELRTRAAKQNALPVFLDADTMEKFYRGFCNSTLWPLFHYFPTYTKSRGANWPQYSKLNNAVRD